MFQSIKISLTSLILIVFFSTTLSQNENLMVMDSIGASLADTIELSVEILNDDPFVAFQCDILLPESMIYIDNSANLTDRKADHVLTATLLEGNVLRIIAFSSNNSPFSGNSGDVMSFELFSGIEPGTFPINLENVIIGDSLSQNICTGILNGWISILIIGFENNKLINKQDIKVKIYPNPLSDITLIHFTTTRQMDLEFFLIDIKGKIVWTLFKPNLYAGEYTQVLKVKDLNLKFINGIYLLKVNIIDREFKIQKNIDIKLIKI